MFPFPAIIEKLESVLRQNRDLRNHDELSD